MYSFPLCVCACVRACVCACVRACVRACACVFSNKDEIRSEEDAGRAPATRVSRCVIFLNASFVSCSSFLLCRK